MIKNRLKVILAERNLNMRKLAQMTGLKYTTINRFEKDDKALISKNTLDAVCATLDVQPGDIFIYEPDDK